MIEIPEESNYDFYKVYTDQLTHKQNITFMLYCAELSFVLLKDEPKLEEKAKLCIDLVKQWLEDTNSVTQEQLRTAAAADAADADDAVAAWAAWAATWTAWTAWAATWAAWTAWAATWAAWAAWTADAAANVAAAAYAVATKIKIIPYLSCLISVKLPNIKYSDPLEQLVYYTDQLNLQLLIPSINGYRLNLWDKSYEYQIEGSMKEIVMVTGIKYLLKGIQI